MCSNLLFGQINNAVRLEETGFGYRLDPMSFTGEQLIEKVTKALNDENLKRKMKQASERIRKANRIEQVADQVMEYINLLIQQAVNQPEMIPEMIPFKKKISKQ